MEIHNHGYVVGLALVLGLSINSTATGQEADVSETGSLPSVVEPAANSDGDMRGAPHAREATCVEVGFQVDEEPPVEALLGGGLAITATFNPNITTNQQVVIQQAINEWQAIVVNTGLMANPYPITFLNGPLGGTITAQASTSWSGGSGSLTGSTVTIDNDGTTLFFVDTTPGSDLEFDAAGDCSVPACMNLVDLLSTIRHEIGHALGWTGAFGVPTNPLISGLVTGTTFDSSRLSIGLDPGLTSHSDPAVHPNELMSPRRPAGRRRAIKLYPTASLPARGINDLITMEFLDANNTGTENGSADNPWNTFDDAVFCLQGNLLVIPGTYVEPVPSFTTFVPCVIRAARGGNAIITAQ